MPIKICVDRFLFLPYCTSITTSSDNVSNSQSFQTNCFKCPYSKKYTLLNIILVNIWNHGKNLQDLLGQNDWKNVGLV